MKDLVWNFVGILDTEKKLHPIPKNIQIQALFEYLAGKRIEKLGKKLKYDVTPTENPRQYPDCILTKNKPRKKIIAIDIKTTRRINSNRVSGFTLGSYGGYFRSPKKKKGGCVLPYGKINEHWIVGFIYTWDKEADTLHMVSDIDLIVQKKWKIASKSTGTGTTTAIGSIKNLEKLKKGKGDFKTEKDFLKHWRRYKLKK